MSSQEQSKPSAFMREELERALAEQSFGISSYETTSSSPLKATARVVLLEGEVVLISLTSRGFQLHSPSEAPMDPDHDSETVFETIEQLLQTVSPQYESKKRSALMEKLESLSDPS
ncbi:GSKIP domain-containing protein [Trametes polyzona]|nr:GSKIP domain-containing protein [Trametes polyzona]